MKSILQINSSLFEADAQSSRLASQFVDRLIEAAPGSSLMLRDLGSEPVPHLTRERFAAFSTPAERRSDDQARVTGESDQLIAELKQADVIVLAVPMYNFGIPSTLKAYIDHVARAGETFRYTADGPVGLLTGKKAYVFSTRGGVHAGTPRDLQTDYLRLILGFMGINDVEFVYAEGIAMGDEQRASALAEAETRINRLAA